MTNRNGGDRRHPNDALRDVLRRRVRQFYQWFNEAVWDRCYGLIDPVLVESGRVDRTAYSDRMAAFRAAYGTVRLWHVRLSLHLEVSDKQQDRRPFAYVYVVWQDEAHGFHMFRERWVLENGAWHTRVVGLVPNRPVGAGA